MSDAAGEERGLKKLIGYVARCLAGCLAVGYVWILLRNRPVDLVIPTHSVPANNAYIDFARAGRLSKAMKHPDIYDLPNGPNTGTAYMALSARDAAPALSVLHGALGKPCVAPAIRSSKDDDLQDYAGLRELARTAAGTAAYYEQIGQTGRAADTLLDGCEMGVSMPKGGNLLTGLVGATIQSICSQPLDHLLQKLSISDLAHVSKRLDQLEAKQVPFGDILVEEGNASTAMSIESMQGPDGKETRASKAAVGGSGIGGVQRMSLQEVVWATRFLLTDKSAMLRENQRYMHSIAQEARKPYTGPFQTPIPNNVFAEMMMPTFSSSRRNFAAAETVLALIRVETALYRYKAETGHFPATLPVLTSEKSAQGTLYLTSVPADPFGGGALHYSLPVSGKTFLLYSIGTNFIDDHGVPQKSLAEPGGDIVAGKIRIHRPRAFLTRPRAVR